MGVDALLNIGLKAIGPEKAGYIKKGAEVAGNIYGAVKDLPTLSEPTSSDVSQFKPDIKYDDFVEDFMVSGKFTPTSDVDFSLQPLLPIGMISKPPDIINTMSMIEGLDIFNSANQYRQQAEKQINQKTPKERKVLFDEFYKKKVNEKIQIDATIKELNIEFSKDPEVKEEVDNVLLPMAISLMYKGLFNTEVGIEQSKKIVAAGGLLKNMIIPDNGMRRKKNFLGQDAVIPTFEEGGYGVDPVFEEDLPYGENELLFEFANSEFYKEADYNGLITNKYHPAYTGRAWEKLDDQSKQIVKNRIIDDKVAAGKEWEARAGEIKATQEKEMKDMALRMAKEGKSMDEIKSAMRDKAKNLAMTDAMYKTMASNLWGAVNALGVPGVAVKELTGKSAEAWLNLDQPSPAIMSRLTGLEEDQYDEFNQGIDTMTAISGMAGQLEAGLLIYGAAGMAIDDVLVQLPGPLGAAAKAYPKLTSITATNILTEAGEAYVRKVTGQEYTFNDFMINILAGAIFESALLIPEKIRVRGTKGLQYEVLKKMESAVKVFEDAEGRPIANDIELYNTVKDIEVRKGYTVDDFFIETRRAYLKDPKKGRPGIEEPAPLPKRLDEGEIKKPDEGDPLYKRTDEEIRKADEDAKGKAMDEVKGRSDELNAKLEESSLKDSDGATKRLVTNDTLEKALTELGITTRPGVGDALAQVISTRVPTGNTGRILITPTASAKTIASVPRLGDYDLVYGPGMDNLKLLAPEIESALKAGHAVDMFFGTEGPVDSFFTTLRRRADIGDSRILDIDEYVADMNTYIDDVRGLQEKYGLDNDFKVRGAGDEIINMATIPKIEPVKFKKTIANTAKQVQMSGRLLNFMTPTQVAHTGTQFRDAIEPVQIKFPDELTKYTPAQYRRMDTFLNADSTTGYALMDGDYIISLFNKGKSGNGQFALVDAIENGGRRLDALDNGYLRQYYEMVGFEVTGREPNWTKGKSDVIYMTLNPTKYAEFKKANPDLYAVKDGRKIFTRSDGFVGGADARGEAEIQAGEGSGKGRVTGRAAEKKIIGTKQSVEKAVVKKDKVTGKGAAKDASRAARGEIKSELSKKKMDTQKELTAQKKEGVKEVRGMAKKKKTLGVLRAGEGGKAEKLRDILQKVAKRTGVEKAVAAGTYAPATGKKVRASGGVSQSAIKIVDTVAGIPTRLVSKYGGKLINFIGSKTPIKAWAKHAFTYQQNLPDDIFKLVEDLKKGRGRENKAMEMLFEDFKGEFGKIDDAGKDEVMKYLLGQEAKVSKEIEPLLKYIREEIDIEGVRQVMLKNLDPEVYFNRMGSYMRRIYEAHNIEGFEPIAQKYNNLKNALMDHAGMDGPKAEAAIVKISQNNIDNALSKSITPVGVKTGGGFTKARKLKGDPVSLAIRDFLGEIKDPVYLAQRTLFELKKSRLNGEFLRQLAETDAIVDAIPAGRFKDYTQLNGKEWGALDGKYIDKAVLNHFKSINGQQVVTSEVWGKLTKVTGAINNFIKSNLTTKNPSGQVRNFLTNFENSKTILGHNYQSASGAKDLLDSFNSFKNKDEFFQELMAYGRLGDSGPMRELGRRLEEVLTDASKKKGALKKTWEKIDDITGKAYEAGDNLFLMANYKKLRSKGMDPLPALKEANRVTPDYGEINPYINSLRKSIFGTPFITWRYKVYPQLFKEAFKNPVRASQSLWMPYLLGSSVAATLDMTDEEKKIFWTKMTRDGEMPVWRDGKSGDVVYFNWGTYTPWADAFKSKYIKKGTLIGGLIPEEFVYDPLEGYIQGAFPGIGSFPVQSYLAIANNFDNFYQRPVYNEDDDVFTKVTDIAAYLSPQVLPLVGAAAKNMSRAASGDITWSEAAIRSGTGLRVTKASVGKYEAQEKYGDPDFSMDEKETEIRKRVEAAMKSGSKDPAKANEMLDQIDKDYPDYADFIKSRQRSELSSLEGKSKKQADIREEIKSIFNMSKIDPAKANERMEALEEKHPDLIEYITKKANQESKRLGIT